MAERYTVYSDVVSSTFKLYLEYELRDNGGKYYDVGVWDYGIIGTSSTYRARWNGSDEDAFESTFYIGSDLANDFENSIYETVSIGKNEKISFIDEKSAPHKRFWMSVLKRTTSSGYVVEASTIIPSWFRNQTSMPSTTAKIRFSITVPALTKPVASITATRDEETPTTLGISVTVNSFKDDEISSITVVDGNGNPLGSTSSTIVIPSSGQIVQPFVTQGVTTGSITAKVVVIGLGGASAEASVVIPVAFFTMDVQRGGKEIAFGSSAIDSDAQGSEHGIFNCFMDAKFHNGLSTESPLFRTEVVSHPIPKIDAHSYASNVTVSTPKIDGYTPIAISGWGSGSYRIYASTCRLLDSGNISLTLGNSTATNVAAGSYNFSIYVLYVANGLI